MPYNRILDTAINAGRALYSTTMKQFRDNQDVFNGKIGTLAAVNILNGSFEVASSNPDIPENWSRTLYPGGTGTIDSSTSSHGANSYKFTHPGGGGNGGGDLESDFFEIGPLRTARMFVTLWTGIAAVRIKVMVEYFTIAQVSISSETLYNNNSTNPTSETKQFFNLTIPATARYIKVTLVGGDTDTDPGASTDIHFDDVLMEFVDDATITQAKLKTLQGEVSRTAPASSSNDGLETLPGGEYGFFPRHKYSTSGGGIGSAGWTGPQGNLTTSYSTRIMVFITEGGGSGSATSWVNQRYVTSSGEIWWMFFVRDKATGNIKRAWSAPDHPSFGNGGDPDLLPHPFMDYDEATEEVICIQGVREGGRYPEWLESIRDEGQANGKGFLHTVMDDYEVDNNSSPPWDARPVTVGLDHPDPRPGDICRTIKKPVPQAAGLLNRSLKRRA